MRCHAPSATVAELDARNVDVPEPSFIANRGLPPEVSSVYPIPPAPEWVTIVPVDVVVLTHAITEKSVSTNHRSWSLGTTTCVDVPFSVSAPPTMPLPHVADGVTSPCKPRPRSPAYEPVF